MEVLLVDDDDDLRAITRMFFEADGFSVLEAVDGEAALGVLDHERPDAVILDVMMPGIDGFTVLDAVRSQASTWDIRVVMLTCKTEPDAVTEGWTLEADDYLAKPFDPQELVDRVRMIMEASPRALRDRRAELLERLTTRGA